MKCLECGQNLDQLDNEHLAMCCGLTLQEYSIKHHVSLDLLVNESMVNVKDDISLYSLPAEKASLRTLSIIKALLLTKAFNTNDDFICLHSDARRLDELLWYLRELQVFGFQYKQEYSYSDTSHRVLPINSIKTPQKFEHKFPTLPNDIFSDEIDFALFLSVVIAQTGELRNGYVFLSLPVADNIKSLLKRLTDEHQIRWTLLDDVYQDKILYRTESLQDSQRLLDLVKPCLTDIPCVSERFFARVETALVSKELVFDSAHFITDHPGKCENLHGGRYTLNVKIKDRVDPLTGFVIDYGYLKAIVKKHVINKLDHQNLNYVCTDLAWRSSTELLNIFIWEQLINYLPGLVELQTYETTQSYCQYQGPSLEEFLKAKKNDSLKHFSKNELGKSILRQQLKVHLDASNFKVVD